LAVVAIACGGGGREGQDRHPETVPETAAVETASDSTGRGTESGTISTSARSSKDERSERAEGVESPVGAERPDAGDAVSGPQRVAPASEGDELGMKNWLLIEFARAIKVADLEWLEQNGFRVDTVLSSTTVRGWLEDAAGGAVIGRDPRIARIDAQMR
jgi:hypothetical protein